MIYEKSSRENNTRELKKIYADIKNDIDARLNDFKMIYENGDDDALLRELLFCVCTPQNNAQKAWGAVLSLEEHGFLYRGTVSQIATILRDGGVRFHNNKAKSITINAKEFYPDTKKHILEIIAGKSIVEARNELAKNIRGWGLKEASHFLRNIGASCNSVCILDRHILRQLELYNVIAAIPDTLSKNNYLEIESAMLAFAKKEQIPADALDLLFWYKEKNELFK
jgi:N-glycosylase/DNA lyase